MNRQHTLHEDFFYHLAELLHDSFREVVTLFGFFEPLIEPCSWQELGRARLGDGRHDGSGVVERDAIGETEGLVRATCRFV